MKAEPFEINVPQEILDDLVDRLKRTCWPDQVEGVGWDYGTNLDYMKDLTNYWQHQYDWRKHEAELNKFVQFKAAIDGIGIHFLHERGRGPNPLPVILTHGWPDSFYRFHKIIPMLTDPGKNGGKAEDSFDVVVPSLPGFGFSGHQALSADGVANLWAKLMAGLGYKTYTAVGGDLGSGVTKSLAVQYPKAVTAMHLTDVGFPTGREDLSTMSEAEQKFAGFIQQWLFTEGAYVMIQGTKPQTLAYALNDSPVGLAAWHIEKFRAWSDCQGDVEKRFTKDELLTHIMIYWVTATAGSAARMYLQNVRAMYVQPGGPMSAQKSEVPAAVVVFPSDTVPLPREWAERNVNLKRYTIMTKGGHFAALEEPELFVNDLREFFCEFRGE